MIPVFDLNQVRVAWVEIQAEGFVLYGFMFYTDGDQLIADFMSNQSGLAELDHLSGDECAIFVIESPSRKWVSYAKRHNHAWWRLFGSRIDQFADVEIAGQPMGARVADAARTLLQHRDLVLVSVGEDRPMSLTHLLEPDYSALYDRIEAYDAAKHFGIARHELPCLVFFRDLDKGDVDVVCLRDIHAPQQATLSFRDFFDGPDFKRMLDEARSNA